MVARLSHDTAHHRLANAAALTAGIYALSRVLANSEAFRALQEGCETTEPTQAPLDIPVVEGLFAALCLLSAEAMDTCMELLERAIDDNPMEA